MARAHRLSARPRRWPRGCPAPATSRTARRVPPFLLLLCLAALSACGDALGPRIEAALLAELSFGCGRWYPHEPPAGSGVFDVFWGGGNRGAEARELTEISLHGGRVLHAFNVRKARVLMPTDRVHRLSANIVRGVADPDDFRIGVSIGMHDEITEADLAWFESLGAEITHQYRSFPSVRAELPDAVIPTIRAHPRVRWVESGGLVLCVI